MKPTKSSTNDSTKYLRLDLPWKLELISSWTKLMKIMYVYGDPTGGINTTNNFTSHTKLLRVKVAHVLESFCLSLVKIWKNAVH